ncbi:Maf family protein [Paenibacillus marinisediminis]
MQANDRIMPLLILASSSPRRKELIHTLGLPVEIIPSGADEIIEEHWTPEQAVEQLALLKATDVAERRGRTQNDEIVIGSDTIVVLDHMILGKPKDDADAFRMLSMLQGRSHEVYTGVACIHLRSGHTMVKHRLTRVWMRSLSNAQIERYIATGEPLDKAGAYGIQGVGAAMIDRIDGCYYNVVGLPVSLLADMLTEYEVETP